MERLRLSDILTKYKEIPVRANMRLNWVEEGGSWASTGEGRT